MEGFTPALHQEDIINSCLGQINGQHSFQHSGQYATLKVSEETKEDQ